MMKPSQDPAFPAMVLDILSDVLARAGDPGDLAGYVTEHVRELTGARCAVLLQCVRCEEKACCQVLDVSPRRKRDWAETPAAHSFYQRTCGIPAPRLWRQEEEPGPDGVLRASGFESSLAIPLNAGAGPLGMILLFGLQEAEEHLQSTLVLLTPLSQVVALMFSNAQLYRRQEETIEARTRELQLALMNLSESETKWRVMFENSRDAIGVFVHGAHVFANPAYLAMFGYSHGDELAGRSILDCIAPSCRASVQENLRQLVAGKTAHAFYETMGLRADGVEFNMEISISTYALNETEYTLAWLRDITERKRAEAERVKLEAELRQTQKMESVGRLAGGVAHDFNNLLTVINGYSEMTLARLKASDPLRDSITEIHKAGQRAAGLTRQLLAFSRKQVMQPRTLDLNRVVEEMRSMLERLVGEDVAVCFALHTETVPVHADPHQLEQVVMNLTVNARDAMPDGGRLLIETALVDRDANGAESRPDARAGRYAMLAVSDTGSGMDEATRQRIFEPFFTTKGPGKGTGLGLSTVHGIVAQSGGYIDVDSELGRGTAFRIYLPALIKGAIEGARAGAAPVLGGTETVLVVEDQASVRNYVAVVLNKYGYRVLQAENADAALLHCQQERIRLDLVLTDVVMPDSSGMALSKRIGDLHPGIKVLFMSGYTDDIIAHHGVLEDGVQFLVKPFSPEELVRKVREVLGGG